MQIKLSFWTVLLQLLIGLGLALLLNMRTRLLEALRTVFLIPMVLPPIVVAIIWKVIYTPDISPMHGLFRALGWNVPALITDPNWALTSIIIADTWEWFPFTMLMVLAALQMMPAGASGRRQGRRRLALAAHLVHHAALHPGRAAGRRPVPPDRFASRHSR